MLNKLGLFILITGSIVACENDIDLNTEFEETTVVVGLLDHNADSQFIKITKTFLDDNQSAIDLAQQGDRLFYDTLDVLLIEDENSTRIRMQKIDRPRDPGLFTTERNEVYFTDIPIKKNTDYRLRIVKPDGSVTKSETTSLDTIVIESPRTNFGLTNKVSFYNRDLEFNPFVFKFVAGKNVAEFQVVAYFHYIELIGSDSIKRSIEIPLTQFTNPDAQSDREFQFLYDGSKFFDKIEKEVPVEEFPTKKLVEDENNFEIQIYIADPDFSFFRNLNGPIEGLAQVRPEFNNIEGGIGLFASRLVMKEFSRLDETTRNYLVDNYRETRRFVHP